MPVASKTNWFKSHWPYLLGAVALHAAVAGLFGLAMLRTSKDVPPPTLAIEAVVVDAEQLANLAPAPKVDRERQRREAEERAAQERRRKEQEAELEQRRLEAERAEAERVEAERQTQQREQERVRQERERAEQERLAREQAEAQQRELERKRQEEAERQAKLEAERQAKLEAERKRVAEIQRKQREREEAENAARERALREELAAEESLMQARASGAMSQYAAMIQQHVERQWNRPPSARAGIECEVTVTQSPNGTVLRVQVGQCNGDQAVRQSIENAVQRASPLPLPPDSRLFERNLRFIFKPAD